MKKKKIKKKNSPKTNLKVKEKKKIKKKTGPKEGPKIKKEVKVYEPIDVSKIENTTGCFNIVTEMIKQAFPEKEKATRGGIKKSIYTEESILANLNLSDSYLIEVYCDCTGNLETNKLRALIKRANLKKLVEVYEKEIIFTDNAIKEFNEEIDSRIENTKKEVKELKKKIRNTDKDKRSKRFRNYHNDIELVEGFERDLESGRSAFISRIDKSNIERLKKHRASLDGKLENAIKLKELVYEKEKKYFKGVVKRYELEDFY